MLYEIRLAEENEKVGDKDGKYEKTITSSIKRKIYRTCTCN